MRNLLEPMGNPRGNHDHIALAQMMNLPPLNFGSKPLAWRSHLASHHFASRDECRFAVDNVEDVGLLFMKFDVPVFRAVSAHDEKIRSFKQRAAMSLTTQCRIYLVVADVSDRGPPVTPHQQSSRRQRR